MSAPLTEYTTFHKLLDYLQYYQEQSPMLNTFGYGNLVDFGKNISGNSVNYPFLFVVPQAIEYQDNMTVYSVSMIFADRLNWDLTNEKDCVSDMSLEARRFLSYIKRGINTMPEIYDNIDVELPINALPFFERFGDHVAGVALEVPLIVYDTIDACDYYPSPTPTPVPVTATPTPTLTPTNTTTPTQTPTNTSTPTTTPTNTPTNTQTPTNTPTPSSTPQPITGTCWCYYVQSNSGSLISYTDCFGNPQSSVFAAGTTFNAQLGSVSFGGFAVVEDCVSNYLDPYLDALNDVGYSATTQEVNALSGFVQTLIDGSYLNSFDLPNDFTGMYPMLGGSAASTAINLMNPGTYDLSYSGTPSYDLSGVTFGSGDYAVIGTGLTQSQIGTSANTHTAMYVSARSGQNGAFGTRSFSPDSRYFMRTGNAGNLNFAVNWDNITGVAGFTGDTGAFISSRVGTDVYFSTEALNISNTNTPVAPTNLLFGVGATFTDGNTIFEYMDGKMSYFSWGIGINGTGGNQNYVDYINTLQTNLGRQAH